MRNFPNLIIAGAPKSGSSSLFFWLAAHPEVCASKVKETYFLSDRIRQHNKNLNLKEHGWDAYSSFFSHCSGQEKYRLEATPSYIYDKTPIEYLSRKELNAKIVFILRKPGDRLYSHWRFNRYRMKHFDLTFEQYLDYENFGPANMANYIERSRYVKFLEPWLEAFGRDCILVYQFEKLKNDPKEFMTTMARDLGIATEYYNDYDFFQRNETVAIGNKKLHKWGLKLEPYVPQFLQELLIPVYLRLNSKKAPAISEKDQSLKNEANKWFTDDNIKLEQLFPQIDLSLWK